VGRGSYVIGPPITSTIRTAATGLVAPAPRFILSAPCSPGSAAAFDPDGILNPGTLLDAPLEASR
jgi:hypothetical protein